MREIKLKAYIPQMKRVCFRGSGLTLNEIRKLDESYFRDDIVWVEFTGLHDKNGNEIYEGDIVKSWNIIDCQGNPAICEVKWDRNYYLIESSLYGKTGLFIANGQFGVEVIGNIYENPELLEH